MKWIGQHIWEFITRFRSDVYIENITEQTQSKVVGIDDQGRLYKQNPATGGSGDITTDDEWDAKGDLIVATGDNAADRLPVGTDGHVLTADSSANDKGVKWAAPAASGITVTDGNVSYNADSIEFQGDDVYVFDQGNGDILVIYSDQQISQASNFGSMNLNTTNIHDMRIAEPHTDDNYNFFAGTWGGLEQDATSSNLILSTPNYFGNAQGDTIIKATLQGATNNSNEVYADLGSAQVTVEENGTVTTSGITIDIDEFIMDIIPAQKKAKIIVEVNPATLSGSTTNSGNGSGSQKLRIKVEHLQSDGSAFSPARSYTSVPVFYDARTSTSPSFPSNFSIVYSNTNTKYLSNIKYISGAQWTTSGNNVSNFYRDTNVSNSEHVLVSMNTIASSSNHEYNSTTQRYEKWCGITGFNPSYSNKDDVNTVGDIVWNLNGNKFGALIASAKVEKVEGGLANDAVGGSTYSDIPRLCNTYSSSSTVLSEDFKSEEYRMPHKAEDVAAWLTLNATETTLDNASLNSNSVDLEDGKDHLVQYQSSYSTFALRHPYDLAGGGNSWPTETSPNQDKWTGNLPAQAKKCEYIRYFVFGDAANTANVQIHGLTRSNYKSHYDNGDGTDDNIKIYFTRPGIDTTWVPLNPYSVYNNAVNNGEDSCWWSSNNFQPGDFGYDTETDRYNLAFNTGSALWAIKIEFNGHMNQTITGIDFASGLV